MADDAVRDETLRLMGAYQTLIAQKKWDAWIDLWAEDGVLEFPYAPKGRKARYAGKAEIKAYMSGTAGKVAIDEIADLRVIPAQDPRIAVVEVSVKGRAPNTGARYDQSYVTIFETQDGKLKRYREYWNPLISIDAQGGDRIAWESSFGSPEAKT